MKNPNFYYLKNLDIIENDLFEVNNAFDIYSLQKNKNKIFLCGSHEHKRNILTIFEFEKDNFKKKLSLKNHKEFIVGCKYFLDKKSGKEYLASTDNGQTTSISLIWIILDENTYQNIFSINSVDRIRFPFSLIFNYNEEKEDFFFIHPSSDADSVVITKEKKIYKTINFTTGKIYYYIIWENHRNSKNFVIQCNEDYVYIYYIFDKKLDFIKLEYTEITGNNYSACILYNRKQCDYLCIVNENMNIVFYDLLNNNLSSVVKINDNALINICEYNEEYLIVLSKNGHFMVLDYYNKKIISKININANNKIKTLKLINHKEYGQYLIIGGFMTGLIMYKNKPSFFLKE